MSDKDLVALAALMAAIEERETLYSDVVNLLADNGLVEGILRVIEDNTSEDIESILFEWIKGFVNDRKQAEVATRT